MPYEFGYTVATQDLRLGHTERKQSANSVNSSWVSLLIKEFLQFHNTCRVLLSIWNRLFLQYLLSSLCRYIFSPFLSHIFITQRFLSVCQSLCLSILSLSLSACFCRKFSLFKGCPRGVRSERRRQGEVCSIHCISHLWIPGIVQRDP